MTRQFLSSVETDEVQASIGLISCEEEGNVVVIVVVVGTGSDKDNDEKTTECG